MPPEAELPADAVMPPEAELPADAVIPPEAVLPFDTAMLPDAVVLPDVCDPAAAPAEPHAVKASTPVIRMGRIIFLTFFMNVPPGISG